MKEKLRKRSHSNIESNLENKKPKVVETARTRTLRSGKVDEYGNNALHLELIGEENPAKVKKPQLINNGNGFAAKKLSKISINPTKVRRILKNHPDMVDSFNYSGEKPIDIAIRDECFENVLNILKASNKVSVRVFAKLMKFEESKVVQILDLFSSKKEFEGLFSFRFIKNFIDEEDLDTIRTLYENGYFNNHTLDENGQTFLHYFVTQDKLKLNGLMLEFLLERLPLDQQDDFEKTAFVYVLESKKELYVQLFLNNFELEHTDLIIDEKARNLMRDKDITGEFSDETKERISFILKKVEENIATKLPKKSNFYSNFYKAILENNLTFIEQMLDEQKTNPEIMEHLLRMNVNKSLLLKNALINGPLKSVRICLEQGARLRLQDSDGLVINKALLTEKSENNSTLIFHLAYSNYQELFDFVIARTNVEIDEKTRNFLTNRLLCKVTLPLKTVRSEEIEKENFNKANDSQESSNISSEENISREDQPQTQKENNVEISSQVENEIEHQVASTPEVLEEVREISEEEYVFGLYQRAISDNDRENIIKLCNKYKTNPRIIEEILKADLDAFFKISILFFAVKDGPIESVKIALKHDIPIKQETFEIAVSINKNILNQVDEDGKSLIFHLANSQYSDFAKVLIRKKILLASSVNPDRQNFVEIDKEMRETFTILDLQWSNFVKLAAQGKEQEIEESLSRMKKQRRLGTMVEANTPILSDAPRISDNQARTNNR